MDNVKKLFVQALIEAENKEISKLKGEDEIEGKDDWKYYLEAYRESKVADTDNSYLQQYYTTGCANSTNLYSMYYELQRQEALIAPYIGVVDIYVLDGVGAEYIPLIIELLELNGYGVEYCEDAA